jgi:hypothetical protein
MRSVAVLWQGMVVATNMGSFRENDVVFRIDDGMKFLWFFEITGKKSVNQAIKQSTEIN